MRAADDGHVDAVHVLLVKGANTNLKDKDGLTARDYALRAGHMDLAGRLS